MQWAVRWKLSDFLLLRALIVCRACLDSSNPRSPRLLLRLYGGRCYQCVFFFPSRGSVHEKAYVFVGDGSKVITEDAPALCTWYLSSSAKECLYHLVFVRFASSGPYALGTVAGCMRLVYILDQRQTQT